MMTAPPRYREVRARMNIGHPELTSTWSRRVPILGRGIISTDIRQ
jgi:hypothetical protein